MKVIVPNELELTACSVEEDDTEDGVEWVASNTYAKTQQVRYKHIKYESLADNNQGNTPSETYSGEEAKWKKLTATSAYKMLDDYVETQTEAPEGESLTFTVPFNRATAFAMFNMVGETAHITITDDDTNEIIHEEVFELIKDIKNLSAFEYFFDYIEGTDSIIRTDITMPLVGHMDVEILSSSETHQAKLGHVVVGRDRYIGMTKYDAEVGITDYSRKTVDEFGVTTLIRRSFARRATLPLYVHPDNADGVAEILSSIRAKPVVFQGDNRDDGHTCLIDFGWLEDWRLVFNGPNEMELNLEIQGMI